MSGTSADGVDAVLASFKGQPNQPNWELVNHVYKPYPKNLKSLIIQAGQGSKYNSLEWLELSEAITEKCSEAAQSCDPKGLAELIGCHGQTVWHQSATNEHLGKSLQLLQPSLLAQLLKRKVVYDFRAADIALGGQGAPLVTMTDVALIGKGQAWQGVLNLGGIANITIIPPKSGPDRRSSIHGWDCGPANSLIDLAVEKHTEGQLSFDTNGLIAKQGVVKESIVKKWLNEPFFKSNPPKSTGREQFGLEDLNRRLKDIPELSPESQIATLTAFTAAIIAQDFDRLESINLVRPSELFVAGGGAKNIQIMNELRKRCLGTRVTTLQEKGISSQAREALAFGLLAWWHIRKHPGNSPAATGARRSAILGIKVEPN